MAIRVRSVRSALLLVLSLPEISCGAGWHRIEPAVPSRLPQRQQVQVWQDGHFLRLHAVSVTDDSVSGVPYLQAPECDSCRVTVPSASVDSMRKGNPSAGFWKTTGLVLGSLLALALVACATTTSACDTD